MGAGNPLIRSFDEELYSAKTYFIDFTECYESKEDCVKESLCCDENFEDFSEAEIDNHFYYQMENDVDNFRNNYLFETEFFQDKYWSPKKNEIHVSELSAAFRGDGIVLAISQDAFILTTTAEYHHFALGIVPRFKYDDIYEDVDSEHQDKWDWYQNHNKDYYAMIEKRSIIEYNKRLKQFLKNNEPTMRKIHQHYGKQMRARNGAWMSMPIKTIGKQFKFL